MVERLGPIYLLRQDAPEEPIRFGFLIQAQHSNRMNACHGGALATFLDISLGFVGRIACADRLPTPTISLSMDFLQGAALGEWIESRVRLVRKTNRMFFIEGWLVTVNGPVLRGNGVYRRSSPGTDSEEPPVWPDPTMKVL
jgi:acyl-coenzyme A thioesterase PaaI-like protein